MSYPILFWLCPTKSLESLIESHTAKSGFGDWMHIVQPQNGFIYYSTAQQLQHGAFKGMREGQIDLLGERLPFLSTPADAPASESG